MCVCVCVCVHAGSGKGGFRGDAERWPGGGVASYMKRVTEVSHDTHTHTHTYTPCHNPECTLACQPRACKTAVRFCLCVRVCVYVYWRHMCLCVCVCVCVCARVSQEIMPLIQNEFSVASDPELVSFGGGSFGGVCALYVAMHYPHLFGRYAL